MKHSMQTASWLWIAVRMRWQAPQRQMLVMASLMPASVGCGFSFRSATAAMICPIRQ